MSRPCGVPGCQNEGRWGRSFASQLLCDMHRNFVALAARAFSWLQFVVASTDSSLFECCPKRDVSDTGQMYFRAGAETEEPSYGGARHGRTGAVLRCRRCNGRYARLTTGTVRYLGVHRTN